MNRLVAHLGIGFVFLLFSVLATWYEGSEIMDRTFEWKYSTPFSGVVLNASDISQLDYFVYATKFKPTFPVVMALSSLYLLIVVAYYTFKKKKRIFTSFLSLIGAGLLFFGWELFPSTTEGAQVMSYTFLSCGVLCIAASLLYYFASLDRKHLFYKS
jgi:hypothetical protein